MIGKRMIGDIGEKFFEVGASLGQQTKKQVVKGIPQSAKKQIIGEKQKREDKKTNGRDGSQKAQKVTEGTEEGSQQVVGDAENTGRQHFAHLLGSVKTMTPQQIQQAKKQDDILAAQKATQVRAHLQQYSRQEQELKMYRAKKAQELPAYIAGKPGQAVTPEEQAKKIEELKKKEEEEKKEAKPLLPPSVSRLFGTREKGKFVIG